MKEVVSMLEDCSDLLQCETVLADRISGVRLLGELPFTLSDLDKLDALIMALMQFDRGNGMSFLEKKAPACLACFLVWHGIYSYKEGNYWSAIENVMGELDAAQQGSLGNAFLSFLRQRDLPVFTIAGARLYVTTILIHGGIPIACLEEYFEQVIDNFIKHRLVEADMVALELAIRRDENEERLKLGAQIDDLRQRLSALQQRVLYQKQRLNIAQRLEQLVDELESLFYVADLPQDCRQRREELQEEIERLEATCLQLKERIETFRQQEAVFTDEDKAVLSYAEDVKSFQRLYDQWLSIQSCLKMDETAADECYNHFIQLWVDVFGCHFDEMHDAWLKDLDIGQILALLDVRDKLEKHMKTAGAAIWSRGQSGDILYSYRLKTQFMAIQKAYINILNKLRQFFEGVPTVQASIHWIDKAFVQKIELFRDTYLHYLSLKQQIEKYKQLLAELDACMQEIAAGFDEELAVHPQPHLDQWLRRLAEATEHKRIAEQAELELTAEGLNDDLEKLNLREIFLHQQLAQLDKRLFELGCGSIEEGLNRLERYYAINNEIENLRSQLGCQPDRQFIETLQASIRQDEHTIAEFNEKVQALEAQCGPAVLPYVSEPVRRFLIYGGDEAVQYLSNTISMAKTAYDTGKVDDNFYNKLPAHVIEAFKRWLLSQKHHEIQKLTNVDGNRFISPYVRLSGDLRGIEIYVPKQHIKVNTDLIDELHSGYIYLVVRNGNRQKRLELSGRWSAADEIEIDEKCWPLPFLSDSYKVELLLSSGCLIYTWEITGIDEHSPCLAFNCHNGKLLTDIPKDTVWLLLREGHQLEQMQKIVQQTTFYGLSGERPLIMVDLSHLEGDHITIVNENGTVEVYPLRQKQARMPVLNGCLSSAFIEGVAVYADGIPSLQLPLSIVENAAYWRFSLWAIDDKNFISKHKRLADLISMMHKTDEETWLLPLENPELLDNDAVGRFVVNVSGSRGTEYDFEFGLLPGVSFDFEKDIYIPHLYPEEKAKLLIYLSEEIKFMPQQPAFIVEEDIDFAIAACEVRQSFISGSLCYESHNGLIVSVSITIPRLLWCVEDTDSVKVNGLISPVQPLWIGWWQNSQKLSLSIILPSNIEGFAILFLKAGNIVLQRCEGVISKGMVSLDLMRFYDTLKTCDDVAEFALTISTSSGCLLNAMPLFEVRTSWRIDDWRYAWLHDDLSVRLRMDWIDLGQQTNRAVQLWRPWQPQMPPIVKRIPDGLSYVEFNMADGLMQERYICRFYIEDKWAQSDSNMSLPSPGEPNVFEILPEDESCISDVKVSWNVGGRMLTVHGRLMLQMPWQKVSVFVITIQEGMPVCEGTKAEIMHDGCFETQLPADKRYAHWMIIAAEGTHAVYAIFVLPQTLPVDYPVDDASLQAAVPIWDDLQPDIKVRMENYMQYSPEPCLFTIRPKNAWKFDASFMQKLKAAESIEAKICLEHKDEFCKLSYQVDGSFFIEIQSGVKCKSCGAILPDQDTWDQTHYPRCDSFEKVYDDRIQVEPFLTWSCRDIIDRLSRSFKRQRWYQSDMFRLPIELHDISLLTLLLSNTGDRKPDDLNALVCFLRDKELMYIMRTKSLLERGVINAH